MISIKSTSCINGFKKILRMSKFCGIIPLDEQCHLRPVLTLVTTVIYLSLFAFISSWFWLHYLDLVNSDINNLLTFFRNCCCTVSLILISYRFTYKRHVLRAAMWSLTAIDKALLAGNLKWDWSIHPIMFGGNFIAVTASLIFHLIWKGSQVCPLFLIFYTHLVLMMLGIAQFCTFLNFIRYCLKQIGYCKNPEHYPKLYSCIESVSLVINDIYGQGIICIIVALYLGILHHLYNLFSFLDLSLTLKWNNLLMVTTYTIILLQIILTCQKLAMQVSTQQVINVYV